MGSASKNVIIAMALLFTGCGGATSWGRKLGRGADGREQILVTCTREVGRCYTGASHVCKYGFDVVPMSKNVIVPSNSGAIVVECHDPPPAR